MVNVEKMPFLTKPNVAEAKVVDVRRRVRPAHPVQPCGHGDARAVHRANRGRKIAVFTQFGEQLKNCRWLAAPVISHRISDGVLIFTPDASREEAEDIALA